MTIAGLLRKVQGINLAEMTGQILTEHTEDLADLNRKQLMQGRNNKGELISPRHSENPFFKTPAAAQQYAIWKQKITPETPFDVPNFFVTGTVYHPGIKYTILGQTVQADNNSPFAAKVDSIFGNTVLGLNDSSKEIAFKSFVRAPLVHNLAGQLGVNVVTR